MHIYCTYAYIYTRRAGKSQVEVMIRIERENVGPFSVDQKNIARYAIKFIFDDLAEKW